MNTAGRLMQRIAALEKRVEYLHGNARPAYDSSSGDVFRAHENISRAVGRLLPRTVVSRIDSDVMEFRCPEENLDTFPAKLQDILSDAYLNDDCPVVVTIVRCYYTAVDEKLYVHFSLDMDCP